MSSTGSAPPVDLEERTAAAVKEAEEEDEVAVVDPRRAKIVHIFWDVCLVLYLLFNIGLAVYMVKYSHDGWLLWLCLFILLLTLIGNVSLIPKIKKIYVKIYATKRSTSSGSDLSTKLLASEE